MALALGLGILMSNNGHAQFYNKEVEAKLKITNNNEFVDIVGTATNKTEINQSLRYELSVIKNQGENYSKNNQSGRFVLAPNQTKELSKTSINIEGGSRIIILLLVYDIDDNLLGKDRYVINDEKKNKKMTSPPTITAPNQK